jgi:hypothetical protein
MPTVREIRDASRELGRAQGAAKRYEAETKLINLLLQALKDPSLANLHDRLRLDLEKLLRKDVE